MSQEIIERLQWLLHYEQSRSASATCDHFNISRSTFYRWLHRFNPEDLQSLTDHPTRPEAGAFISTTSNRTESEADELPKSEVRIPNPELSCPFCRMRQRMPRPTLRQMASLILFVFILTILLVVLPAAAGVLAYRYSNPLANISEAFQMIDK
jgi:transposase-like protein